MKRRDDGGLLQSRPVYDVLVIGGGPVGLACAIEVQRQGLSYLVLERGSLLNTLRRWPTHTVFFSTPELLEIGGIPFVTAGVKPTRREGLVYYRKVKEAFSLDVRVYEEAREVVRSAEGFSVTSSKGTYEARKLIVATGFYDNPNFLNVPGEDLPNVTHYYGEPFAYAGTDVLVVGGKNSAVEAALDLYRNGARVTIVVRRPDFGVSVKYWLRPDVENRVKEGAIRALFETCVVAIAPEAVTLSRREETFRVPNDFVLALTGYHPDYEFLKSLGIEVTQDRCFVFDPKTMETNVPGVYVAGVVAGGARIGSLFIENGRAHAVTIVKHLLASLGKTPKDLREPLPLREFPDGD